MEKSGMKITSHEVKGNESELECKIDPTIFAGEWLEHQPTTSRQEAILTLYQDAKAKGRLHVFTCMTIDPSIKDGKLVYQKGLPPAIKISQFDWEIMLSTYNPSRHSRQMTLTEYAYRNLFLIQKLVKSGCGIEKAWVTVCDDSKEIGHYRDSNNAKNHFEPTGSRDVCGFCDLGNTYKLLAEDPWKRTGGFWEASASFEHKGIFSPVADFIYIGNGGIFNEAYTGVAELALD